MARRAPPRPSVTHRLWVVGGRERGRDGDRSAAAVEIKPHASAAPVHRVALMTGARALVDYRRAVVVAPPQPPLPPPSTSRTTTPRALAEAASSFRAPRDCRPTTGIRPPPRAQEKIRSPCRRRRRSRDMRAATMPRPTTAVLPPPLLLLLPLMLAICSSVCPVALCSGPDDWPRRQLPTDEQQQQQIDDRQQFVDDRQQPVDRQQIVDRRQIVDQQQQPTDLLQSIYHQPSYGQNQRDNIDNSNIDVSNQFHLHESSEWPFPNQSDISIGQISGVSVSNNNLVYIFHRGDREWNQTTFHYNNVYRDKSKGPITGDVVVILDPKNGSVINRWGSNRFYMPHGITVDHENNVWLTDVALHQVFKFGPSSENSSAHLLMTLGTKFEPGNDFDKFCKPTSVAVTTSGEFYIADGYCNSRIVKFSAEGRILLEWGRSTKVSGEMPVPPYQLWIPHALTLAEDKELICVADRENSRVLCFNINNGTFVFEINPKLFQRVFSVAYSPIAGGLFYVLNDKNMDVVTETLAQGIVVNATSLETIGRFHPGENEFSRPHDMAVSPDGTSVYVVELIRSHIRKFVLDSDIQINITNESLAPLHLSEHELMLYKYNMMKNCPGLRENSGKQILVIMLIVAVGLFFTAAIFVTVLIYTRTKSMAHRKNAAFSRWQPRTLNAADGFTLGNMFNKKQRAGFEKLATVEVSEDDDDDDDNDLNVRA